MTQGTHPRTWTHRGAAALLFLLLMPTPVHAAASPGALVEGLNILTSLVRGMVLSEQIEEMSGTSVVQRLEALRDELTEEATRLSVDDRVWAQEQIEIASLEISRLNALLDGKPSAEELDRTQAEVTALAKRLRAGIAEHERRVRGTEDDLRSHDERLKRLEERFILNPRSRIVKIRVVAFGIGDPQIPRELSATAAEYLATALGNDERVQLIDSGPADVEVNGTLQGLNVSRHRVDDYGMHTLTIRYTLDSVVTASRPEPRQIYTKESYTAQEMEFFPDGRDHNSTGQANVLKAVRTMSAQAAADLLGFLFWDPLADAAEPR